MNIKQSWSNGIERTTRTISTAGRLGWVIESNWTDPFLFAVYSVVRPLSGAAILVVMFGIIAGGDFSSAYFPSMYLGNAFYMFVGTMLTGISWSVTNDREQYKTLKYIFIAPIEFAVYLVGRSIARVAIGFSAVAITLACGVLFLHLSIPVAGIDWLLFVLTFALGMLMLSAMGLLLAGAALLLPHNPEYLGDTVSGALFLFSGAVFPLDVLPWFLRPVGYAMPLTYWFELIRRSLVGPGHTAFPGLLEYSTGAIVEILAGLTLFFCVAAFFGFRWCAGRAREKGLIDWTSNY